MIIINNEEQYIRTMAFLEISQNIQVIFFHIFILPVYYLYIRRSYLLPNVKPKINSHLCGLELNDLVSLFFFFQHPVVLCLRFLSQKLSILLTGCMFLKYNFLKCKSMKSLSDMHIMLVTSFSSFFLNRQVRARSYLKETGIHFDSIQFLNSIYGAPTI